MYPAGVATFHLRSICGDMRGIRFNYCTKNAKPAVLERVSCRHGGSSHDAYMHMLRDASQLRPAYAVI